MVCLLFCIRIRLVQRYYDKLDIQLYLDDCIEILEKATQESINMMFADPPYMLSRCEISCQVDKNIY